LNIDQDSYLQKLEWSRLCENIAQSAQSEDAKNQLLNIAPVLGPHEIELSQTYIDELKNLNDRGYKVPIQAIDPIKEIVVALRVGRSLYPEQLLSVLSLLRATKGMKKFAADFEDKSQALRSFNANTYALPKVQAAIEKAVGPDGSVLDSASTKLKKIRNSKTSLRKHIEDTIRRLIQRHDIQKYLQDDFFSIRNERYTIPMTLDGHGRIEGIVQDTSDSGQSLFIEPKEIQHLNEELIHVFLEEKIEIGRILKEISLEIEKDLGIIEFNYKSCIELETLWAKCEYAAKIRAHKITLSKVTRLIQAAHPLLDSQSVIKNDIELMSQALIISGPNAGGKTVVLKTLGILALMTKAGLLIPCHPDSTIQVFDQVFIDLGDSQSLSSNLSTFSGHIFHIKKILEALKHDNLVLIDEICVGTAPETGAALAQAIIEECIAKGSSCVITTHFERLKKLAFEESIYRNASMEFKDLSPTYRLIYDIPGKSYGLEVAKNHGLQESVIARAQNLLGSSDSKVEDLIDRLYATEAKLKEQSMELAEKSRELEELEDRYTKEKDLLSEQRQRLQSRFQESLEDERQSLKEKYQILLADLKEKILHADTLNLADYTKIKAGFDSEFEVQTPAASTPHSDSASTNFEVGMSVFVESLGTQGEILAMDGTKILVKAGGMQVQTTMQDLKAAKGQAKATPKKVLSKNTLNSKSGAIPFVIATSANSLNICGLRAEDVEQKLFSFLDHHYRGGESQLIIIHGHGVLKQIVRKLLQNECPYPLRFRPGEEKEGLDAVTIITFQ
jgi:DNA mismatch repair protein MutS2